MEAMEGLAGVSAVIALALLEYSYFLFQCGQARGRNDVPAPTTWGNPEYERYFRVQMNTVEHLVMFIPGMWMFGHYVSAPWAMGLGLVFVLGRALYARAYWKDPAGRGPGFLLTLVANASLVFGSLIGATLAWWG